MGKFQSLNIVQFSYHKASEGKEAQQWPFNKFIHILFFFSVFDYLCSPLTLYMIILHSKKDIISCKIRILTDKR